MKDLPGMLIVIDNWVIREFVFFIGPREIIPTTLSTSMSHLTYLYGMPRKQNLILLSKNGTYYIDAKVIFSVKVDLSI